MARIPTLIPESVVRGGKRLAASPLLDLLWKLFVTVATMAVILALGAAGGVYGVVGGVIAFILASVLLERQIREVWSDIWNRNFWVWRVN